MIAFSNSQRFDSDEMPTAMKHLLVQYIRNLGEWEDVSEMRAPSDAIADFARSGSGCSGGNHGSIFFDEEASAIKNFIASLAEIAATTVKNVAQWLVWVAKEIGKLTDMELHRADSEVGDIMDGKYDWRIEKLENHNGLTR